MENYNQEKKGMSASWIYLSIILLLIGAGIYFYLTKSRAEDEAEEKNTQLIEANTSKDAISQEYNAALARLDQMSSDNTRMDSLLKTKDGELAAMRQKIEAILHDKNATTAQLKEAQVMIAQLNTKMNSFQTQIVTLKQDNAQLTEEKKQAIEESNNLKVEKKELTAQKESLEKKVELGSVLHASGIKLDAINQKKNLFGKEKEKETSKAKKADLIRISFDIDDNRITESGEKVVYICISDPSGTPISSDGTNTSKFKTTDGNEKIFTVSKNIPYKQGEKTYGVSTDWKPFSNFMKGAYNVDIYHMGYKIGGEVVQLK